MTDLLEEAAEAMERDAFFERMEAALIRLRDENPEEWESYLAEGREWEDATIADGIDLNEPW